MLLFICWLHKNYRLKNDEKNFWEMIERIFPDECRKQIRVNITDILVAASQSIENASSEALKGE